MSPGMFWILMYLATALVMLFQFRALLQSSSADYYHPITQAVTKLTNPLVNVSLWRNMRLGSFFMAGMIVSLLLSIAIWLISAVLLVNMPIFLAFCGALILWVKSFGYLLIVLLLVQALCSWLPATRSLSYLLGQATSPITAPVQRIIPPIGMIDISLMIVLFALYALNALILKVLLAINFNLGQLWYSL